jgi:2'-5' RNA ligase
VAVAVPEPVRDAVAEAAAALRRRAPRLRWVEPERWHLTAAFLGWTDPARLGAIQGTLAEVAERSAPFPLELDATAGSFRGGVLWAGVAASEPFATLAGRVQSSLAPLGFEFERRAFHPHLTLARAPRGQRVPADLASGYAGPAARWKVDRLELQRSRLARAGAAYELIASWRLGAGA